MPWFIQERQHGKAAWQAYAWTAGALAVSAAAYLLAQPLTQDRTLYLIFLPAAVVGGLAGGFGAASLATLSGLAIVAGLSGARLFADPGNLLESALYLIAGLCIGVAGHIHQRRTAQGGAAIMHLAESEARLRSILETVPDAMIVIDHLLSPGRWAGFQVLGLPEP